MSAKKMYFFVAGKRVSIFSARLKKLLFIYMSVKASWGFGGEEEGLKAFADMFARLDVSVLYGSPNMHHKIYDRISLKASFAYHAPKNCLTLL